MIRREIHFPGQPVRWWIVSQIEHARVSGVLADRSKTHFPELIRSELHQAIIHHDDGWAAWEEEPQLDETGRPMSFRELPLEMSLPIWTASIEAAAERGSFAAWVVAAHFLALLSNSDKQIPEIASEWRSEFEARRVQWFANWQTENRGEHTAELASEGLRWLQLFDVMSLWLCSVCPGEGEQVTTAPESYHLWEGEKLETKFTYASRHPRIEPWRFDSQNVVVEAEGWVVPIREYLGTKALLDQREPHLARWQLQSGD